MNFRRVGVLAHPQKRLLLRFGLVVISLVTVSSSAWVTFPPTDSCAFRARGTPLHASTTECSKPDLLVATHTRQGWWENDNVRTYSFPSMPTNHNPWRALVPPTPWSKGLDVSVEFDDAHEGAEKMAEACFSFGGNKEISTNLEKYLLEFQSLVKEMCPTMTTIKCKARIVATRGHSGTKCPRWHLDHVPVRWVQSLVGPGCTYVVGDDGINRNALNGLDLENIPVQKVNEMMVSMSEADVRITKEGDAVALVGKEREDNDPRVRACVHKSPELHPLEGRVLLTIDVLPASQFSGDWE